MSRFLLTFALAAGLAVAAGSATTGARADDKKADTKVADKGSDPKAPAPEITPAARAVQNLQLGYQLADYARKNKLPDALVTAARIIGTTPIKEAGDEKLPEGLKPYDALADAVAMLDEAGKMPEATEATKKAIAETDKMVRTFKRGAIGGAKVYEGVLGGGQSRSYNINFAIGQLAEISVRNTTSADLDLYVVCNASGWNISDRRSDDDCRVRFTVGGVSKKGFNVRVYNYSPNKTARYVLFTN